MSNKSGRIYLSPPDVSEVEKSYLNEAFDSNWIAPLGPFVDRFEKGLSELMQGRPVVALSSGTSAIHLALIRLGVGPGDIVIVQSFTFCATANPVKYLGADVVFVGSEKETWNICPESLETAILDLRRKGRVPKAIIPVNLYGIPAKLKDIKSISNRYEIPVIEDAAESLGSLYNDRPTGTFGDFGVLSFNGNKIITTSGGGALVCPNEAEYHSIKHLATQARDSAQFYLHSEVGYNYRLSNLSAAIGVGQLEGLGTKITRRRAIHDLYKKELSDLFVFPEALSTNFENRWLTVAVLNRKASVGANIGDIVTSMDKNGIECRHLWKPLHSQPVFSSAPYYGTGLEMDLFQKGLCLPSGSSLSEFEQQRVISCIRSIIEGVG